MYHWVDAQAGRPSWSCSGVVRHPLAVATDPPSKARAARQCAVQTLFSVARRSTMDRQPCSRPALSRATGRRLTLAWRRRNGCSDTSTASVCEQSDRLTVCCGRIFCVVVGVDEMSKLLRTCRQRRRRRKGRLGRTRVLVANRDATSASLIQPLVTDFAPPPSRHAAAWMKTTRRRSFSSFALHETMHKSDGVWAQCVSADNAARPGRRRYSWGHRPQCAVERPSRSTTCTPSERKQLL